MMSITDFEVGDTVQINPGGKEPDVTPEQLREGVKGVVKEKVSTTAVKLEGSGWHLNGYYYYVKRSGRATFLFCKC